MKFLSKQEAERKMGTASQKSNNHLTFILNGSVYSLALQLNRLNSPKDAEFTFKMGLSNSLQVRGMKNERCLIERHVFNNAESIMIKN